MERIILAVMLTVLVLQGMIHLAVKCEHKDKETICAIISRPTPKS